MKNRKIFSGNSLKWIAIVAMTLDHSLSVLFPQLEASVFGFAIHAIGRLTAPIMFFFISEGFFYTKSRKKYIFRLFLFAILSHFAYCFAFSIPMIPFTNGSFFNQTGVIWALAWSAVALELFNGNHRIPGWLQIALFAGILVITFPADWSCIAVLSVVSMYDHRGDFKKQMACLLLWTCLYAIVSFFFVDRLYGLQQLCVVLAVPVLSLYNGKKGGGKWSKWLFYVYYPLHLFVLGLLAL